MMVPTQKPNPSNLPQFLIKRSQILSDAGIESAREETEWILCYVLDVDRLNLYLHGSQLLDENAIRRVDEIIARRATRYPLQYILGEMWFYGRKFYVDPAVMVPTPETEGLCEAALGFIRGRNIKGPSVLDIGAGSGVISVTMALELAEASIVAVDLSEDALLVAEKNARDLGCIDRLQLRQSDLFAAIKPDERFDLILSNPPYICDGDYDGLPPEVKADPKLSLVGGGDGLDIIRRIVKKAPDHLAPGGRIMFEIGLGQSKAVAELTDNDDRYRSLNCIKDLNDIDRIMILACDE